MAMANKSSEKVILCFLGISSLLIGLFIYVIFRENTYVAQYVAKIVDLSGLRKALKPIEGNFIKFYFPDYLWGVAFASGLHTLFLPTLRNSIRCSAVVFICGTVYEFLQYCALVPGTGDLIDVILYLLSGTTVSSIVFFRRKKDEKRN